MARYGCTITVDTGKMPSSQTDFVWLATEDDFPTAAIDAGLTSIDNGGGNLRCYTDDTKATQLPIEVVTFVTGGTPSIQVWGLSPTLNVASTVYIEADTVATTQPAVGAAFGRNATWVDYAAVLHMNETGSNGAFTDSTGNGNDTTKTSGGALNTTATGHPFGGTWPDFTQDQALTLTNSAQMLNSSDYTLSHWISADIVSGADGAFGNRYSSNDTEWVQQNVSEKISQKGSTSEDSTAAVNYATSTTLIMHGAFDSSSLVSYKDGVAVSTQSTIINTTGISTPVGRDYRVGTYFDNATGRRLDGRICEARACKKKLPANYIESEYNNQSDPATFWTVGAWEDQDAGGGFQAAWAKNANTLINWYN